MRNLGKEMCREILKGQRAVHSLDPINVLLWCFMPEQVFEPVAPCKSYVDYKYLESMQADANADVPQLSVVLYPDKPTIHVKYCMKNSSHLTY